MIEFDQEDDGRIIAEIHRIPGCLAYGKSKLSATVSVLLLAKDILVSDFVAWVEEKLK